MKTFVRILALVLSVTCGMAQPSDLDAWVARAMKTFEVPGIAVGIVKDGKVVVARGYGVRKLGDSAPVDADTLFGIASNSKAFTSAALAILADENKLKWDDSIINYLPQTFAIEADGKIGSVKMEAVSDLADFSFDYQDLHLKMESPGN